MAGRRPYASRGVMRRRSTGSGGSSRRGFLALLALSAVVVVAAILLVRQVLPAPDSPVAPGQPFALARPAAGEPQPRDLATAAAQSASQPTAVPTQVLTLRRWELNAEDVRTEPALIAQLDQALAGVEGTVSIAVKDLGSGRGAVLDGNREMEAASLFKLPILYAVFDAGLPMTEQMVISQQALSYDLGTMELGAGETLSVAEALERMVTISDTTSAIMLGGRVGAAQITRDLDALGMDTTHYSLERMTTSAQDMLSLLEAVARGKAVSPSASADMLHLLLRQRVNDRLPRLLPDDAQVAHKTGNLPGIVNDVGILYGPNSTVAIAALISDTSNEAAAASAIARASLVAYTYFEQQPAQNDRPRILPAPTRAIPPVWRQPRPPPPPTAVPTLAPTPLAILEPTVEPTLAPTVTAVPTMAPTLLPTATPIPTPLRAASTAVPAQQPTPTPKPPAPPTAVPKPPPPTAAAKPAAPTSTPARSR